VKFLAEHIADAGSEVSVLTSRTEQHQAASRLKPGLEIFPVVENWGLSGLFNGGLRALKNAVRDSKPDIINIVYPDPYLKSSYLLPYAVPFVCGKIPVITTLFHFFPRRSNVIYKLLASLLYFGSERVHFHNRRFMSLFVRVLPFLKNRAVFIPVGNLIEIDKGAVFRKRPDLFRKLGLAVNCRYISFFGYWYRSKGIDVLLRAFALVAAKRSDVRLLLVGGPKKDHANEYEQTIISLIEKLGLSKRVIVTGHCPDAEAVDYLLCSDFCVFPFKSNTTGRTSIMLPIMLGIPFILSGETGADSLFRNNQNVVLVKPGNFQALAEAIEGMLKDEELLKRISKNLPALADNFSWRRIVESWVEVYKSTLLEMKTATAAG
jgi:glycosyltransferase involved in cell wall biosynthesis